MAYRVFIDGQAGTTGLRLAERLAGRADIELLEIGEGLRKDIDARLSCIAEADITFLCLPDEGAREIVAATPGGRIIDCSTAHRIDYGWTYGMPEIMRLDGGAMRVANPGCHATGFILSVRPLVEAGIVEPDAALCCYSLTGYSGGGKPMIAEHEGPGEGGGCDRTCRGAGPLVAPRRYATGQRHKHLPEMQKYSGLETAPLFSPIVCDYYCGMLVGVPLPRSALRRAASAEGIWAALAEYYEGRPLVKVRQPGCEFSEEAGGGFLSADAFANRDDIEIFVTGEGDRIEIVSRYDNLGKGASGAAIQNMNLMLGLPETAGLFIGD